MNSNTFELNIKRLGAAFGEKNYSRERIKLFWEIVKDVSDLDFSRWVDGQISDKRYGPLGDDFRKLKDDSDKYNLEISRRKFQEEFEKRKQGTVGEKGYEPKCRACQDNGELTARHKENKGTYTFVCHCEAGEGSHWAHEKKLKNDLNPWTIPRWSKLNNKAEYELLY